MSLIRNGFCAALLSLSGMSAQAAEQIVDFEVEIVGFLPAYVGAFGHGTLRYDDADLTGVGDETMTINAYTADPLDPLDYDTVAGLLSFSLTLFVGETYEQTFLIDDDIDHPDFPEVYFFDGELYGMDFAVYDFDVPIDAPDVFTVLAAYTCGCGGEFYDSTGGITPDTLTVAVDADIPVPAALPLMLGGLGLLGVAARRRRG